MTEENCGAAVVRDVLTDLQKPQIEHFPVKHGEEVPVLLHPAGMKPSSIKKFVDEYRIVPERRTGTATFTNIASLVEHANRFKGLNSILFANDDPEKPSISCVLDYHEEGPDERAGTHNCTHRSLYNFPLAEQWSAWAKVDKREMHQGQFAAFIEERISDLTDPVSADPVPGEPASFSEMRKTVQMLGGLSATPSKMVELSRGLQVNEKREVANAVRMENGTGQVIFKSQHTDATGQELVVPSMFFVAVQVFRLGAAYMMPVRLSYRLDEGKILWKLTRYRADLIFDNAFNEAVTDAAAQTGLPLLFGRPEI